MKKKVLTVMAVLALMGGKAFAYDYQWVIKDLAKNLNVEKESSVLDDAEALTYYGKNAVKDNDGIRFDADGSATGDRFGFTVEAKDKITVKMKNTGTSAGTMYIQPENGSGSSAAVSAGADHTLTLENVSAGKVSVYAPTGFVVTEIIVESQAYRDVLTEIGVNANGELDNATLKKALKEISVYTGADYGDFYSAVSKVINEQGTLVQGLLDKLNAYKEENSVSGNKGKLLADLAAYKKEIEAAVTDANAAAGAFKNVKDEKNNAAYVAAKVIVDKAYGKPAPTEADYKAEPNAWLYTYTFKDGKATKGTEKAPGLEAYMNTFAKKYLEQDIKNDSTVKYLAFFPYENEKYYETSNPSEGSYPTEIIENYYKEAGDRVPNIIGRFLYEKDHAKDFTAIISDIEAMQGLVGKETFFTEPVAGDGKTKLSDLKKAVDGLYAKLNDTDKHSVADCQTTFATPLGGYKTQFGEMQATWTSAAEKALKAKAEAVQTKIDEFSSKISSQFANEPETQKLYQKQFAELQARLDKIFETADFNNMVKNYESNKSEIEAIEEKVDELWTNTREDQNKEILANNTANLEKLNKEIEDARKVYSEGVQKINGYLSVPAIANDETASTGIKEALNELFATATKWDTYAKDAKAEVDKYATTFERFDYESWSKKVAQVLTEVKAQLDAARNSSNLAAYSFLTGYTNYAEYGSTTESSAVKVEKYEEKYKYNEKRPELSKDYVGTVPYAVNYVDYIKGKVEKSDVKAEAETELEALIEGVKDKNGNVVLVDKTNDAKEKGYVRNTKNYINKQADLSEATAGDKNVIADEIATVKEKLAPVITEANTILENVKGYDELANSLTNLRVRWTVAKAGVSASDEALNAVLTNAENAIKAVETQLGKDKLAAFGKKESYYDVEFAKIEKMLWNAEDPEAYNANETAHTTATEELAKVKAELTAALETVAGLTTPEVVTEYTKQLNGVSFTDVEKAIETAYDERKAEAELDNIKDDLKAISTNIANIVEAAKAADEAAQVTPGDLNGDKVVDAKDFTIIMDNVANGTSTTEDFVKFVENYKKANNE